MSDTQIFDLTTTDHEEQSTTIKFQIWADTDRNQAKVVLAGTHDSRKARTKTQSRYALYTVRYECKTLSRQTKYFLSRPANSWPRCYADEQYPEITSLRPTVLPKMVEYHNHLISDIHDLLTSWSICDTPMLTTARVVLQISSFVNFSKWIVYMRSQ